MRAGLLSVWLILTGFSLRAEERILVAGAVRTIADEPVIGADVWVVEYQPADWPLVLIKSKTDEHGEFVSSITLPLVSEAIDAEPHAAVKLDGPDFDRPPIKARRGRLPGYDLGMFADPLPRCLQVWVRTRTHQLGWSGLFPIGPSLRTAIVLQPVGKRAGIVETIDGAPIKEATARLVGLPTGEGSGRGSGSNRYCLMPREWTDSFVVRSDADGQIQSTDWPTGDLMVSGSGEGFAEWMVIWPKPQPPFRDDSKTWRLRLIPVAPLRGEVRGLHLGDLPKPERFVLRQREMIRLSDEKGHETASGVHFATTTVRGRKFVFENAPKQHYSRGSQVISIAALEPTQPRLFSYFTTDQEHDEQPVLLVYRNATIRGRMVDEATGLPVPGVRLSFDFDEDQLTGRWASSGAATNALGEFETQIPIADFWCSTWSNGVRFPNPARVRWDELHPDRPLDAGRLIVRCENRVEGVVVDASGKPVPDAEVFVDLIAQGPVHQPLAPTTHADRAGHFVIPVPRSHDDIWVKARHGDAVSERVQIAGSRLPGDVIDKEVKLTLKPEATTRITGSVVDTHGRPLGGRSVIVWREVYQERDPSREQYTHGGVVETLRSGPDGRFQSSPLWVGAAYFIQARGANGETVNSHRLLATAGTNIEVGRVIVPSQQHLVSGRALDSAGQPVPGALVFASANALRSTVTDAAGRFQLDGLSDAGEVIFVEHSRFRPAARIVRDLSAPLEVRLIGRDERIENLRIAAERFVSPTESEYGPAILPPGALDRESLELAKRAIALLRDSRVRVDLTSIQGRFEPWSTVEEFCETRQGHGYARPLLNALVRLSEENPDRALGALLRLPTCDALDAASRLADWYTTRDPDKAALFADRFLALHNDEQGGFTAPLQLAWAGHWKLQRGRREEGFALLARAVEVTEESRQKRISYGGERTVERLVSRHSPPLAQRIADARPKPTLQSGVWDWNELRSESARAWLDHVESETLTPASYGFPSDPQMLRQIAQLDPATARRLAGLLRSLRHQIGYRRTLMMLALWDQRAAWNVIDDDLLDFRRLNDERADHRIPPVTQFEKAARLLVTGSDVGYPDLDTLIANCMAHRERVTGPADVSLRRADSLLSGLAALTLFAPQEAGHLADELRVAVPRHLLGSGFRSRQPRTNGGVCRADWYLVLALTRPDEMLRVLAEDVAYFRDHPPRENSIFQAPDPMSGITAAADVWTTPPDQRWRFLADRPGW